MLCSLDSRTACHQRDLDVARAMIGLFIPDSSLWTHDAGNPEIKGGRAIFAIPEPGSGQFISFFTTGQVNQHNYQGFPDVTSNSHGVKHDRADIWILWRIRPDHYEHGRSELYGKSLITWSPPRPESRADCATPGRLSDHGTRVEWVNEAVEILVIFCVFVTGPSPGHNWTASPGPIVLTTTLTVPQPSGCTDVQDSVQTRDGAQVNLGIISVFITDSSSNDP
ncbi:hypothetical protein RRG08_062326 [Elysia crispata]|uniref:Uncharacterized protein n=1 Tax=Elysia crispata TaxID=231223 RepID=A0AAE1CYX4_9GAST|nr:hypothetical protein RRG08_062326 [Elysia crispata]